jgi:hypothetical protein
MSIMFSAVALHKPIPRMSVGGPVVGWEVESIFVETLRATPSHDKGNMQLTYVSTPIADPDAVC